MFNATHQNKNNDDEILKREKKKKLKETEHIKKSIYFLKRDPEICNCFLRACK